jgi:hypothetical protein
LIPALRGLTLRSPNAPRKTPLHALFSVIHCLPVTARNFTIR